MIEPKVFAGSAFEVGFERSRGLGPLPMPKVEEADIAFARACQQAVADLCPPLIDLYAGFLEGGGWDEETFLVYYFARRQGMLRGCTNLAVLPVATLEGETLIGRNYDWAYSDLEFCESRAIVVEGRLPFVSYTHHWIGHPDCLNQAGLFVAISSLPAYTADRPGIQWNLLVDAIAMTCRTVQEAVELLSSVEHLRAMTYLLADASDAAAVDATAEGVVVREPEDGIVIATNHAVGSSDGTDRTKHSVARYDRARERLLECTPDIEEDDIKGVLTDPVCTIRDGKRFLHELDHVPLAAKEDWGTIWSTIGRPLQGRLKIAEGHPLDVEYVRVNWDPTQTTKV